MTRGHPPAGTNRSAHMCRPFSNALVALFVALALGPASVAGAAVALYYSSPKSNGVFRTDGATFTAVIPSLTRASGIALGADGRLYVSEEGGDQLDRFTAGGARVGAAFGAGRRYTSMTFG